MVKYLILGVFIVVIRIIIRKHKKIGISKIIESPYITVGAGAGFEPTTSGL